MKLVGLSVLTALQAFLCGVTLTSRYELKSKPLLDCWFRLKLPHIEIKWMNSCCRDSQQTLIQACVLVSEWKYGINCRHIKRENASIALCLHVAQMCLFPSVCSCVPSMIEALKSWRCIITPRLGRNRCHRVVWKREEQWQRPPPENLIQLKNKWVRRVIWEITCTVAELNGR